LQGKIQEALDNYAIALKLKPGTAVVLNNMAWIYATHPEAKYRNGAKAVEMLRPFAAQPDCDSNLLEYPGGGLRRGRPIRSRPQDHRD
jgi:Flp pilus assembly protein TadD